MWKKYIAMGIVSVLLLTNIPGTVYAAEPIVSLEEQPEEDISDSTSEEQSEEESPEATGEEPTGEELKESENKELQEDIGTGEGESDEEPSDRPENPASEPTADVEEIQGQENHLDEDILDSMADNPSDEEYDESEDKDLQGSTVTGEGEPSEEPSDNPENLVPGEVIDGEKIGGQENQVQEDEEIHYDEKEMDTTNDIEQDSEETDIAQNEAPLEEIPPLENVPAAQSDTLDVQSTEGEYLPYDGAKYKLNYTVGEEGITINGMVCDDAITDDAGQVIMPDDLGQLVIPGMIEGQSVVAIGHYAFQECSGFNGQLIISDSIKRIGRFAFYGCSGLTGDLIIPQGVTSIGEEAFGVCYGLNGNLTIPSSVTSIGRGAFHGCRFTGNVLVPESVTSAGSELFSGCGFDTIMIGMKSIPDSMLGSISCTVKLLDSVESIEENAFNGSGIKGELIIPDSVKTIGAKAFYDCPYLKKVTVPAEVEELGADAFGHEEYRSGKKAITILGKTTKLNSNALGSDCLIYGYSGSTAEAYAENYPESFISLETTPSIAEYRVTTSQELKDAIGSFHHIVLADGIYEFPSMVMLNGINYLTIEAENPGKVEILSSDFEETVIDMRKCAKVAIKGCILGHGKPELNAGNDEVAMSGCGPQAFVFYISDSFDIDIESCDLFGCDSQAIVSEYCADINVDKCVIRDCTTRITWGMDTDNLVFTDCVMSGCGSYYYSNEACFLNNATVYMKNCLIFNNGSNQFGDSYGGKEVTTVDCIFCNNAWDGETPGTYGICLNGITWQMDGDTLKIGYPLQLGTDKVVQSEKGSVLPYSDSSLPWKNCSYQQIDVAEGVEYDRGNGVTVNTSGADMEVKVPMTGDEYQNLLTGILTQGEMQAVEEGQGAEVEIVVADGETLVPEKDKQTIEDVALDDGYTIGKYLDITMYIQIGDESKRAVEQTKSPVCLVLGIPENLQNAKRNFAVLRMHNGKTDLLEDLDQNPSTVTIETTLFSTYALVYGAAEGVSGNVSGFGGENEGVSLRLLDSSGTVIAEAQVLGRKALYKLENVPVGSYTLRAEKKNHVSRDYSVSVTADKATMQNVVLWLTGDVNGDGKVNAKDKKILYNHIAGSSPLTDYTFLVGDVNRDGKINAKDKKMLYNHIAGKELLWN